MDPDATTATAEPPAADPSSSPSQAEPQPASAGSEGETSPAASASVNGEAPLASLIFDDALAFKEGYEEHLPEGLKEQAEFIGRSGGLAELVERLRDNHAGARLKLDEFIGRLTGEGGTDEQRQEIRKALGVPETADAYTAPNAEGLPEGVEIDAETLKEFNSLAFELGLSDTAAQKLISFQAELEANMGAEMAAAEEAYSQEQRQILEKEFGKDIEAKLGHAKEVARLAGIDPASEIFKHADGVKLAAAMKQFIKEDTFVSPGVADTAATSRQKANDIIHNPNNPLHEAYWKRGGSAEQQKEAGALVERLLQG